MNAEQQMDVVLHAVAVSLKPLAEKIVALESRLGIVEAREYQGVHEDGREYQRGQWCTFKGSVWHCNRSTHQRPGDGPDWTLAVKSGRDGKDAR